MQSLYDREHQLEDLALNLGINRYQRKREAGEEAALPPGRFLLSKAAERLTGMIEEFVASVLEGSARRKSEAALFLSEIEPEAAAMIASRRIVESLSHDEGETLASVAVSIGSLVEEAVQWDRFAEAEPRLARSFERRMAKSTTEHHRRAVLRHRLKLFEQRPDDWTKADKLRIGTKLVELFEEATGWIEVAKVRRGSKTPTIVRPTEEMVEWLSEKHEKSAMFFPMYLPMVVEPEDWTTPFDGGYLNPKLKRRAMIRTRGHDLLEELANVDMPEVYAAVNAVQKTAWRINRGVLDVANEALHRRYQIADLPSLEPLERPERPSSVPRDVSVDKLPEDQQATIRAYVRERAEVEQKEAQRVCKVIGVHQKLRVIADEFKDEERIYFPHYIDFRGRMYPYPTGVSPQGDDLGRALLEFADGKPLGDGGGYWLAVHIANVWGQDKLPLDERVEWTREHSELILDSALRPLDGLEFWLDADKPWSALAAAFEWAGFMIEGDDYVSHLPIAMDGSCSGLQHYSALLRDKEGGRAVNLVADGIRHDIYSKVAESVQRILEDCQSGDVAAFDGKVSRNIVKRPVMTFAYSVTAVGMRDQILDEVNRASREEGEPFLGEAEPFTACTELAGMVHDGIVGTVEAAAGAMDYLKKVSRKMSEEDLPLRWTAPNGMVVVQRTRRSVSKKKDVMYAGRRLQLRIHEDQLALDKRSQASGVAPNFIHSMDAAHLMRTVRAMQEHGVEYFAMIHDSFGTHAADTELLNLVLREEFVSMYQEADWFAEFAREQERLVGHEEMPEMPPKGDLQLESVLESEFFFS